MARPVFRLALRNNFLFALSVPIQVVLPLLVAYAIHLRVPGWRLFRATVFLPAVYATVVIGILASTVLQLDGPINDALGKIGLESLQREWLGKPDTSIPLILLIVVWTNFGYNVLLYLAGMSASTRRSRRPHGSTGRGGCASSPRSSCRTCVACSRSCSW